MLSPEQPRVLAAVDTEAGSAAWHEGQAFSAELHRLAYLAGLWLDYANPYGERVRSPDASLQYGLKALGYAADSLQQVRQSLFELLEKRAAQRVFAPVVVTDEEVRDQVLKVGLILRVSDSWDGSSVRARVRTEDGKEIEGWAGPGDMRSTGSETLGERSWQYKEVCLQLACPLPHGYHRMTLEAGGPECATTQDVSLIVAPSRWYVPQELERTFGLQVQLTGLRSSAPHYWGVGDFACLAEFCAIAANLGVKVVGLNPLHAMPDDRREVSPYSPEHRGMLNPLYISVEHVPEYLDCRAAQDRVRSGEFQEKLQELREGLAIDYPQIWKLKDGILRMVFEHFSAEIQQTGPRHAAFTEFVEQSGRELELYAVHVLLNSHFRAQEPPLYSWRQWPEEFRHPDSPAVREFAAQHAHEVSYRKYLQWIAFEQLAQVKGVRLYRDMALSTPADSAESWADQDSLMIGSSVGAPPEPGIPAGQNWGGTPPHPERLREMDYYPLIQNLRQNLQPDGMLRIDHGMQKQRLYIIPPGASTEQGVYVSYSLDDLMKIFSLESHRSRCLVVCEDLGAVDEGFRRAMQRFGAYGYEIQQNAPEKIFAQYRRELVVTGTNHDTPPMDSFWMGADIVLRHAAGEINRHQLVDELRARDRNLSERLDYLRRNGFDIAPDLSGRRLTEEVVVATYSGLASSPAAVVMVSLQDLDENPLIENMPGRPARFDSSNPWPLLFNRRTLDPLKLAENVRFRRILEAMRRSGRA